MKREILILVLLILTSIFLINLCIHQGHNWGGDFSQYISQAKALVEGSQDVLLEQNTYAMENSDEIIGPYLYPLGFPLLLSPVYYIFGIDLVAMKVYCAGFLILCLPLIYFFFRPKFKESGYALFLVAGIGLHESFLTFTDNILSAFPFLFFLLLCFLLMERSSNWVSQISLGALIFFTFAIRDIGIALLPALFVYQVAPMFFQIDRERKNLLFLSLPYVSFASFFVFRLLFAPNSGESRYDLFSFSDVNDNFVHYSDLISNYLFDSNLSLIFLIPMWFVIVLGMVFRFKKDLHIIAFMVVVFAIYIMWPFWQPVRFLFPLLPFLLHFFIEGILYLSKRIPKAYSLSILFIIFGFMSFRGVKTSIEFSKVDTNESYSVEMQSIYHFISQNVPEDELVGFIKPRVMRLFTDRNGIYEVNDYSTNYLLLSGEKNIPLYKSVFVTNNYTLYEREEKTENH